VSSSGNSGKQIAVIAGAGPAGITAGYELLKRTNIKPLIFEKSDHLGGISRTVEYKGNRIDLGGHRFYTKSQRVLDWWFSILPLEAEKQRDRVYEKGTRVDDGNRTTEYLTDRDKLPLDGDNPSEHGDERSLRVVRPAPDPDLENEVMLQRDRLSRIFYKNVFFPYPLSISIENVARLGFFNTFGILCSYLFAHTFPKKNDEFLDAFFINRFGKRLYEQFFKDYTEKVWGYPCNQIRADWGAQRIKGLSLRKAIVHSLKHLISPGKTGKQEEIETSLINRFFYPKFGPGQMWEVAANRMNEVGCEINKEHAVTQIQLKDNRVHTATIVDDKGREKSVECQYLFSTMPLRELIRIITPAPPKDVLRIAEGLVYRDFITVGVLVNKLNIPDDAVTNPFKKLFRKRKNANRRVTRLADNWIYIQQGNVKVGRIQIFDNWSPYLVADPENTIWLGLEYFVSEGDELWEMPDEDLLTLARGELETIGFLDQDDFLDGCVLRMLKAYPGYFGTYDELPVVYEYLNTIPNLFPIGRNGLHRYNNQDHSMMTAMLSVDLICSGLSDKEVVFQCNVDSDYQEEFPMRQAERVGT
jgi:protoporphyrinogen oxidase